MDFSQSYSIPYHYTEEDDNNQYQQLLTSPTEELYRSSPWSSTSLVKTEMDCEEISQPERGIAGFVSKLYQCLEEPGEGQKYARWCRHNGIDMFIIDCIPKFTEIVLPKLFKHCKFASFVRQLNIYGFQRDTDARKSKDSKDKETCRWHHIYFRPGRRDLFHLIRRKTPRYSRRKRQRPEEEDPETILNVGSGDESDTNNKDNDDEQESTNSRRLSTSSVSASPTLPQTNLLEYDDSSQYVQPQPQQEPQPTQMQPQQQLQPQHPQIDFNQLFSQNTNNTQPISPTELSLVDENSFHPFQLNAASNSNPAILSSQLSTEILAADDVNNTHDLYEQTMAQTEEELCSQIVELRKGYTRMCKILTGEVNKAFNVINAQRARIELLENTLQHQQNYTNGHYFPTVSTQQPINFLQTAPTTPIYHQAFKQESFLPYEEQQQQYNMMFGDAKNENDTLALTSPCTSNQVQNEKWLTPFHHQDQVLQ